MLVFGMVFKSALGGFWARFRLDFEGFGGDLGLILEAWEMFGKDLGRVLR